MANILESDIKFLTGVGEKRADLLFKELNIRVLGDLLCYFPFRYIDKTKIHKISEVRDDALSFIQIKAKILGFSYAGEGRKRRFCAHVGDGSAHAELVWFKGISWVEKRLERGREYIIFGRPSFFNGELSIVHPEIETSEVAQNRPTFKVQGVYSTSEKLSSNQLGTKGIYNLVCNLWPLVEAHIKETLPHGVMKKYNLIPLRDALYNIHFPENELMLKQARYRLKFEELLGLQLDIVSKKQGRIHRKAGFIFEKVGENFNNFYKNNLPFELTGAQKRVVKQIRTDLLSGHQMNRLVQGDVGSGKTLVALMAMLLASDNGFQSCLMAPTEILANQHFEGITKMLSGLPIRVELLTGSIRAKKRRELSEGLLSGEIHILIGTHALIEDNVQFKNLGMVVIDEQHRFGVEQRAKLWAKNDKAPHVVVMTATPIPRTLAMTLYGDLDVSIIDELPRGRKPIITVHFRDAQRLRMYGFMREQISQGRQVYVVYPLIKGSEKMDYKDLYEGFENMIQEFPLPDYMVTALHGKMKADDKKEVMENFKQGQANIMVATSVIEVGVDVPNATVMVIESAERFGLSQLHQLRGRVGRGDNQSYCILMSGDKLSQDAKDRLGAMVSTNDGFRLSELDMKLRGSGDINGTQQSGDAFDLRIANLSQDGPILELARECAEAVLEDDFRLTKQENVLFKELKRKYSTKDDVDFSMIS
ncbi:MAG: ATP-dependent DNA helicase RecG [Rikenellaceae bacterium]